MENEKHHIVPYKTYGIILLVLLIFTGISVAVTQIELGPLTVTVALSLATIKTIIVLLYFMHLKFDKKFFGIMTGSVILLLGVVIFVTLLDYLYR